MSEKLDLQPEKDAGSKAEKPELKLEKPKQTAEHRAEAKPEREQSVEKTRQKIEKALDRETEKRAEKLTPKPLEASEPKTVTRAARDEAFRGAMKSVRSQLPTLQRGFSKFIHAKPVEVTSELLEETIFRPSFLWGGVIGGIIFGSALYIVARLQGFRLSGSEFIFGLFVGGIVGLVMEKLFRRKKSIKKSHN